VSLLWRPIGAHGEAYPAWVRALKKSSGVYAIRVPSSSSFFGLISSPAEVLYVGESHTGNLYATLTRHFQHWSRGTHRKRGFWQASEKYAPRQTDPGHTYRREAVEVAVKVSNVEGRAQTWQAAWIKSLRPRDNVAIVDADPVPF